MISSHASHGGPVVRGIEEDVRSLPGAVAVRVIEAGCSVVAEHRHDWPILSLYVMGDVVKAQEGGDVRVNRPTAVLHGAGEPHSNRMGAAGLEQLDIQFDPAWIRRSGADDWVRHVSIWTGGRVAAEANQLRLRWLDKGQPDHELATATARFIDFAFAAEKVREPEWLAPVLEKLASRSAPSTVDLARELGLHPGWLAQAYKAAVGEGLRQTMRRHRVERATELLRSTNFEAADVAAAAGFCDQSHMIRNFHQLLGRSPTRVRAERERLRTTVTLRS